MTATSYVLHSSVFCEILLFIVILFCIFIRHIGHLVFISTATVINTVICHSTGHFFRTASLHFCFNILGPGQDLNIPCQSQWLEKKANTPNVSADNIFTT